MKRLVLALAVAVVTTVAMWAKPDHVTVIVSLDGFRWDYCEAFDAPFLRSMCERGVKAVMQPSFPSKTFPNHYTLATGLYPDHHGIVANEFKDSETGEKFSLGNSLTRSNPKFYGGDPIWLTAQRQGLKVATVYWVGSDVAVKGGHPNYWEDYQKRPLLTVGERIDKVIGYLKMPQAQRPDLIMAYFEEPDASGHRNGPVSMATRQAFERMDSALAELWRRISELPLAAEVNFIVTGDHGMTWLDQVRTVPVKQNLKDEWGAKVLGNAPALVYVSRKECVDSVVAALNGVDHIRAWKRGEVPEYLHYGENSRIGDVVVLPDVGWVFSDRPAMAGSGNHGFDNTACDMQVGFRAMGPDFKVGYTKPNEFRNVTVYALLCHLLGIVPGANDGDLGEVRDLLR